MGTHEVCPDRRQMQHAKTDRDVDAKDPAGLGRSRPYGLLGLIHHRQHLAGLVIKLPPFVRQPKPARGAMQRKRLLGFV